MRRSVARFSGLGSSTQTNGIVERFHKTMLNEFYRIAFRKKLYAIDQRIAEGSRCLDDKLQPRIRTPICLCD